MKAHLATPSRVFFCVLAVSGALPTLSLHRKIRPRKVLKSRRCDLALTSYPEARRLLLPPIPRVGPF
jgi:hypothetical protein